jgi:hypothetical protein
MHVFISSSLVHQKKRTPQQNQYEMTFADVARDLFSPEEMLKNGQHSISRARKQAESAIG